MNNKYLIISIIVMAIITYLPRALPVVLIRSKINNRFIKSFLTYMPYSVLSAMIFPTIFYSTSSIVSASLGTATAIILSYKNKGLLPVALSAIATVFIAELFI